MMKPIPSNPKFLCNEQGEIYSTRLKRVLKGYIRKKDGYIEVGIRDKGRHDLAHRLIAETWLPNPENKSDVNHKNGIKTDNRVCNLEWATRSENLYHAYRTGLKDASGNGHAFGKDHPCSKVILQCDLDGNVLRTFYGAYEPKREFGFHQWPIHRCCKGEIAQAYGFKWVYA